MLNLRLGFWIPYVFRISGDGRQRGRSRAAGRIRYRFPDDCPQRTSPWWLVLMRTFIVDEMPTDIVALGRGAGPFPRHSTLNQFLSVRASDAYIAPGRWLVRRAVRVADRRVILVLE